MDKSWMGMPRSGSGYKAGVEQFLNFAFQNTEAGVEKIRCPCTYCNNNYWGTRDEVEADLLWEGIVPGYINWTYHGEEQVRQPRGTATVADDSTGAHDDMAFMQDFREFYEQESDIDASKFYGLLKDGEVPLFDGCKNYSRLSFIVHLLHIKCRSGFSNKWFDALLDLLNKAFPFALLPKNYYEARKTIKDLGLTYEKIDACTNDCILFWRENSQLDECPNCNASRWKIDQPSTVDNAEGIAEPKSKIPEKTLRYFRLKPRLQRLFMCQETVPNMTWHETNRINDDEAMRHPADSENWKDFDRQHPTFASDPRNVRLALASDGMNPYGNMTNPHSIWPVVLINYNLPPWMCMKESNFILSMIIPGPKSPGNNIHVYLRPLIEELKELWEGVWIYDAVKKENFLCRAALLCTINDFPALAMLSGWSTKGKYACPCCGPDPCSKRLKNGGKWCYMYHRRFLPPGHSWRNLKQIFNGQMEKRGPPRQMTGDEIAEQLAQFEQIEFGKNVKQQNLIFNWKLIPIFQELSYISTILLFHNVDVMHVEKNVCDIVVGTIMDVEGKTKDNTKARLDLQEMGIRPELHLVEQGGKYKKPPASYVMSRKEKDIFCRRLKDIKLPDGYSSNISRCVNTKERKLMGLKSHDCHVIMEQLLPIAIRGLLPDDVCEAITELCMFFRVLCTRVLEMEDLDELQGRIAITLCKLEKIFPPSFFVVMMHLPIHLVEQAKLGGPVQYRWMYPIERYLRTLKGYVRNKACAAGCMAEGQLMEESLVLISRHFNSVETRFNQLDRNEDGTQESTEELSVFKKSGRPIGTRNGRYINEAELAQIQLYVLQNCDEVRQYEEEHKTILVGERNAARRHAKEFPNWFKCKIYELNKNNGQVSKELLSLAGGPCREAVTVNGYIINGYRFHTLKWERRRKTQNSGVWVDSGSEGADFFGRVTEMIEVRYAFRYRVLLFKCEWRDVSRLGCKLDKYGFTCVNVNRSAWANEPFMLANQAQQVFYLKDEENPPWNVVIKTQPRGSFNVPVKAITEEGTFIENTTTPGEAFQERSSYESMRDLSSEQIQDDSDNFVWDRSDVPVEIVDYVAPNTNMSEDEEDDEEEDDDDDDVYSNYNSEDDDNIEFEDDVRHNGAQSD